MMIKRIVSLCLCAAILLALGICASAEAKKTGEFSGRTIFEIIYDESKWEVLKGGEEEDGFFWLFSLYNDDVYLQSTVERLEGYSDFSLFSVEPEEVAEYVTDTISLYEKFDCEFMNIHMIPVSRNGKKAVLPFLEYRMNDPEYGKSVYMETVTNGYAVSFEIYDADPARPVNQDIKCGMLLAILDTFQPL